MGILALILLAMFMFMGGLVGQYIAPELEERPYVMEVNIEEFRGIDKELDLRNSDRNIEINEEGKVVYVKDTNYGLSYSIVEGEGDISSEDYLKKREVYMESKEVVSTYEFVGMLLGIGTIPVIIFIGGKFIKEEEEEEDEDDEEVES